MTGSTAVVEDARHALGRVGALLPWSPVDVASIDAQREAVRRLEGAGYRCTWTNEVLGKDVFVQLAMLLAATDRMVFGTGIANVWARAPQTTRGAAAQLAQAYPGRLVLGLGVGYPEQAASVGAEFGPPLATMRRYLDRMTDATTTQITAPDVRYLRIVDANGPRMLALAAQAADGAMPAMMSPEATGQARQLLGPGKLLIVLMAAGTAQGDAVAVARHAREHLAAGADNVVAAMPIGSQFTAGINHLEMLATALLDMN